MADLILYMKDEMLDDTDEGVFDQGDGPSSSVVDEDLPPLEKIKKYAFYEKQMVPRILIDIFRTCSPDAISKDLPQLMDYFTKLVEQDEDVMFRTELIKHIPSVATTASLCAAQVPSLSTVLPNYILPTIVHNLNAADSQVRNATHSALFVLLEQGLITRVQAEIQICPTILALSQCENLMDYSVAVTLMSKMTAYLGRDVTERVFLERFAHLCSHSLFNVRKVCASHFGDFCAVVSQKAFNEKLLPCFIALCSDEIWGVRKACAEVMMSISCACTPDTRRKVLAPVFVKLLQDESRWVCVAAFQALGPFISTFAEGLVFDQTGELVMNVPNHDYTSNFANGIDHDSLSYDRQSDLPFDLSLTFYSLDQQFDLEANRNSNSNSSSSSYHSTTNRDANKLLTETNVGSSSSSSTTPMPTPSPLPDVVNNATALTEDVVTTDPLDLIPPSNDPSDIKEIVETVKNAVLIFRNDSSLVIEDLSQDHNGGRGGGGLGGIVEDAENFNYNKLPSMNTINTAIYTNQNQKTVAVDKLLIGNNKVGSSSNLSNESKIRDVDLWSSPPSSSSKKEKCARSVNEDDPLKEFNCYNYWNFKPDFPVDPAIVASDVDNTATNLTTTDDDNDDDDNNDNDNSVNIFETPEISVQSLGDIIFDKTFLETENSESDETNNIEGSENDVQSSGDINFLDLDKTTTEEDRDNSLVGFPPPLPSGLAIVHSIKAVDDDSLDVVPKFLIDLYVLMTDPNLAQFIDNELAYHCAYSLPAVALTLGSKHWNLLRGTVETLAADMQYKIRRTVASSLHELAVILGPEIATNSLAPIFDGFIKDLDEVRIGILRHLAHFLKLISPRRRASYLPRLSEFLQTDNVTNWRFRKELAEQLLLAIPLFRPIDATKYVAALAQELLCDKVAAVREVALLLVAELLRHVSADRSITPWLLVKLAEKFAHSKNWKRRQSFALLCAELLSSRAVTLEQFSSEAMPHLLDLSWDPVANVRIVVARTISKHIVTQDFFMDSSNQHFDSLQTVLRRLQADKDRDVRHSSTYQLNK